MGETVKRFKEMSVTELVRYLEDLWIAWRFDDISDEEASRKWDEPYRELCLRGFGDAWPFRPMPEA